MNKIIKDLKKLKRARRNLKYLKKYWEELNIEDINKLFYPISKINYEYFEISEVFNILYFEIIISNFIEDKNSKEYNNLKRFAVNYAVTNTWYFYNNASNILSAVDRENLIILNYKNKKIKEFIPINLFQDIWKLTIMDSDDWIIAYHMGSGWFWPVKQLNKINFKALS